MYARKSLDPFKDFLGRDQDLKNVTRYNHLKIMLYRTNLYNHSHRVAALVRTINPVASKVFGSKYDPVKAELLAYLHDDAEIVFGDITAGNKSKMTDRQLREVKRAEEKAIEKIATRFPSDIAGYSYEQLLTEASDYSSLESQVVCYADKYDALGEALHEIFAGNHHFTTNIVNKYGRIPTPVEYYADYFQTYPDKFPGIRKLLSEPLPIFDTITNKDYSDIIAHGKPHTARSLRDITNDAHYNYWRRVVILDTNDEVRGDLYTQKEYLES